MSTVNKCEYKLITLLTVVNIFMITLPPVFLYIFLMQSMCFVTICILKSCYLEPYKVFKMPRAKVKSN